RVPRQADALVAAVLHHRLHVRRVGRAGAVDLDPDFDAGVRRRLAARDQRLADLLQRLLDGHRLRQAVGPHLDAAAAEVRHEVHERLARLDVLLDDALLRGVELAHGAAAPDFDAGVGALLLDLLPLLLAEARLDAVLVRGAELDRRDADVLADSQDG